MSTFFRFIPVTHVVLTFLFGCSTKETIEYELTTEVTPQEGGSISPSEGKFDSGEEIKLTATPSQGYYFKNWSGAITGDENPRTMTIDSEKK